MTQDTVEKIVEKLCEKLCEDWSTDLLPEVKEEWRQPIRTALTKAREEGARAERESVVEWAKTNMYATYGNPDPYNNELEEEHDRTLYDLITHLSDK